MKALTRHSPEVRELGVGLVHEHAAASVAVDGAPLDRGRESGCTAEMLRKWVRCAEIGQGQRPGVTTDERERFKTLEREDRGLRQPMTSCARRRRSLPSRSSTAAQSDEDPQRPALSRSWTLPRFDRRFKSGDQPPALPLPWR